MDRFPITPQGFAALEEELKNLKNVERPSVIAAIAEAREHGDLSENAEYHSARERQSFIEGRILELEGLIGLAEVIDIRSLSGKTVKFGATVTVLDEDTEEKKTYQIVSEVEADFKLGKIALTSPLGRALVNKAEGDIVDVHTPGGLKTFEIMEVKFVA